MVSELDNPCFGTDDAARASGMPRDALVSLIRRGDIFVGNAAPDEPGTGRTRRFSMRRVRHLALTRELMARGLEAKAASLAALAFTDHNACDDVPAYIEGEQEPAMPRMLAEPFEGQPTIFRVVCNPDGEECHVETAEQVRANLALDHLSASVILVDMNHLVARVRRELGA